MIRFGVFLSFIGFGSVGLHYFGYHFVILSWADSMQPGIGVGVGVAGLVLLGIASVRQKNAKTQAPVQPAPGQYAPQSPAAQQYPQQQYPQQPGQAPQGHPNPQQQYPQQQYPQQQPPQSRS